MTFETMINNANVNAAAGELAVKVSFGNEMRRAAFNGTTFAALRELVVKLFELEQRVVVLKYQDDDGDKITMSSDGELNDALRLVKDKKILRLFVEFPVPAPTEEEKPADAAEHPFWGHHWRGGRGPHRGGSGRFGGPHAFPHHGPHAFPHHGPHGFSHWFPRAGPHCVPTQATEAGTVPAPAPADGAVAATFHAPRVVSHGTFSPAGESFTRGSPYAARCAFKEHKHAMKEHVRLMKENAITPEDREAIKQYEDQMRAECKARWQEFKSDRKEAKFDRKEAKSERKGREHFVAKHVADITVPDNSELPPDTPVTKTWRLKNAGLVAWPADSQLLFVSRRGDNLNGPERVFVGPVEPQQDVDISVTFLTPTEPGRYIGYYRMASGDGAKFGQRVWVSFIIPAPAAPAVAVAPQPEQQAVLPGDVNMD